MFQLLSSLIYSLSSTGYPDHMMYPAFRRRYTSLLQPEEKECLPGNDKDAVEFIVSGLELERNSYKLGLSQVSMNHEDTVTLCSLDICTYMYAVNVHVLYTFMYMYWYNALQ